MECPCCGRILTKAEEILLAFEEVYYCTHCWQKISDWPWLSKKKAAEPHREISEIGEKFYQKYTQ